MSAKLVSFRLILTSNFVQPVITHAKLAKIPQQHALHAAQLFLEYLTQRPTVVLVWTLTFSLHRLVFVLNVTPAVKLVQTQPNV